MLRWIFLLGRVRAFRGRPATLHPRSLPGDQAGRISVHYRALRQFSPRPARRLMDFLPAKKQPKSIFRKLFFFLPNIYKVELIFEATNEYITLDDLRDFMIERIKTLGYGKFEVKWILELQKAKSYEELILGKQN